MFPIVGLICLPAMTNEAERLFMYLFYICRFSLVKYLSKFFVDKIWVNLSFEICLQILDVTLLSRVSFLDILF